MSNTNDIIEDENEEKKTSLQIENDIKDKNLKFINVKEKSKIEKLKKIIENINPLKFYFNRLKKAIYQINYIIILVLFNDLANIYFVFLYGTQKTEIKKEKIF